MHKQVVTRFAPSPTGHLHIGGARTAIFNWLFSRHNEGKFILRIEDTDTQRSTTEYTESILESLRWLGIDWDEGPYFQTKRLDLYRAYAEKLYHSGWAYYCECSPEEVERRRQEAFARGLKPKYDGTCRDKGLTPAPGRVLRFRCPQGGITVIRDIIKGSLVFDNSELDDLVLIRSDGMPTYNFSVIVDDITMGITHVIRGDDHVNNTPKQVLLYQALGESVPEFAHVPLILGPDRKRLSKRHGATSVIAYRDMGFLPEALFNYLVRLGWSYGDQEIFTREELVEKFTLEHVGSSASIFDMEKLRWINGYYIRKKSPQDLVDQLIPFLKERGYPERERSYLIRAIQTLQARCVTLSEMADAMDFYMVDEVKYEPQAAEKFLTPDTAGFLKDIIEAISLRDGQFDERALEEFFRRLADERGVKLKVIAQVVRVGLTGRTASPGLFEIMDILGKETVIRRLERALDYATAFQKSATSS
ncbi:MAG: glutamate--tRNA ligase [Syntrophobacterales bacterium]|nr:glutamate--tRNA ligase [Syntrophobacterales bacterium]